MKKWDQYPLTRPGDKIVWAPEPTSPTALWIAGMVILEKNQSCDVILYLPEGRTATKHDCWHADDPNCKLTPGLYREPGRGVFRLAPSEVEARDLRDRVIPQLRSEVAMLRRRFEDVLMNADSTRQLQDRPVRPMAGRFQKQEPAATAGS